MYALVELWLNKCKLQGIQDELNKERNSSASRKLILIYVLVLMTDKFDLMPKQTVKKMIFFLQLLRKMLQCSF